MRTLDRAPQNPFSEELCTAEEEWHSARPARRMVYYIKQAFGDPQLELDLIPLIEEVIAKTGCTLVCIEGAEGPVEVPGSLAELSGAERERNARAWVERGGLSAPVYLLARGVPHFMLWGVDDTSAEQRVRGMGAELAEWHELWTRVFGGLRAALLRRRPRASRLRGVWDALFLGDEALGVPVVDDVLRLMACARSVGLQPGPVSEALSRVKQLQDDIDFARANEEAREVSRAIHTLLEDPESTLVTSFAQAAERAGWTTIETLARHGHSLSQEEESVLSRQLTLTSFGRLMTWELRDQSGRSPPSNAEELLDLYYVAMDRLREQTARAFDEGVQDHPGPGAERVESMMRFMAGGKRRHAEFLRRVTGVLALTGLPPARFPNIIRYAQYTRHIAELVIPQLFEELEVLRRRIIDQLARGTDRELAALLDFIVVVRAVLTLKAGVRDVLRLDDVESEPLLSHASLCAAISGFVPRSRALRELGQSGDLFASCLERSRTWYTLQTHRADRMVEGLRAAMHHRRVDTAVLITGGYHGEAVCSRLQMSDTSYLTVMSRVRREPVQWRTLHDPVVADPA